MDTSNGVKIKVSIDLLLSLLITVPPSLVFGFPRVSEDFQFLASARETKWKVNAIPIIWPG